MDKGKLPWSSSGPLNARPSSRNQKEFVQTQSFMRNRNRKTGFTSKPNRNRIHVKDEKPHMSVLCASSVLQTTVKVKWTGTRKYSLVVPKIHVQVRLNFIQKIMYKYICSRMYEKIHKHILFEERMGNSCQLFFHQNRGFSRKKNLSKCYIWCKEDLRIAWRIKIRSYKNTTKEWNKYSKL